MAGPPPEVPVAAILASLPAAVVVVRLDDGRILHMNERAEVLLGVTAEELTARALTVADLWAEPSQRAEMLARLEAEGELAAFPARFRLLDGRMLDALTSFRPIEVAGEACVVAVTYDVSERTDAEQALRRSERRFRQIAESIDEGFVLASFRPFHVHYASPSYAEITGTTMPEVYAEDAGLFARIEPEDRPVVQASLSRMRAGLRSDEVEVRLVRGGELRWIRWRWSVVEGDEPQAIVAAVVEDVTERRRADAEVRRATSRAEEASEAKSSFLSRVSHELRTPLNVILGFGQLLESEDLDPGQRDAVREIVDAGRHLLHLVDEVLEISQAEAGQVDAAREDVAIEPVVRTVLEDLHGPAARRGIEVSHDDPCTSSVLGDPRMLADALRPLVENAIVHNVIGGTVQVACEPRPGDRIRITVADTGPGLSPEDLERVYLAFERTKGTSGAGLGLTLARRLVEAMGGELGARSVPGRGSRFWIDLERAPARASRPNRREGGPARRRRVLYIEDNDSNAELATRALTALEDLDLVIAAQGAEGLALIASTRFDLVLLDLHLPDIDGEEILGRIRSDPATAELPVVVIGADASPEVIARLRGSGADEYLTKPVSVPHLVRVVDRAAGDGAVACPPDVLDPAVLDDLQVLEDVEPGTLRDVTELFARAGRERVDAMEAARADDDPRSLADLAHALRGSGASLGAVVLADACRTLEQLARRSDADPGEVALHVATVREAFDIAVTSLRAHVARRDP